MTTHQKADLDERSLVLAAQHGDREAFEELYQRHSIAAWRLAQAVAPDHEGATAAVADAFGRLLAEPEHGAPAIDGAFRAALLAATRAAAIDHERHEHAPHRSAPTPETVAKRGEDGAVVVCAFADLPERWRAALWLTDVEGMPTERAAVAVGLSADATEQLAGRARAGLRARYASAQAAAAGSADCRRAMSRLVALGAGRLPKRDRHRIERHVAACDRCRSRAVAIDQAVLHLRRVVGPLPVTLLASATAVWQSSRTLARGPLGLELPSGRPVPPWAERVLVGSTAAVVSLGLVAAIALGARDATSRDRGRDRAATGQAIGDDDELALGTGPSDLAPVDLPTGTAPPSGNDSANGGTPSGRAGGAATSPPPNTADQPVRGVNGSTATPTAPPTTTPPVTTPPPTTPPVTTVAPLVELDLGEVGTIEVGPDCTGASVLGTVVGCDPATTVGDALLP